MSLEIESYCKEKEIPLVGKIPFDEKIVESINNLKPIIYYEDSKANLAIREMWKTIKEKYINYLGGIMMKIAIASEGKNVSGHFGHCEGFTMYEVKEDKVLNSQFVPNPGHRPGFLPSIFKRTRNRINNIWWYGRLCSTIIYG